MKHFKLVQADFWRFCSFFLLTLAAGSAAAEPAHATEASSWFDQEDATPVAPQAQPAEAATPTTPVPEVAVPAPAAESPVAVTEAAKPAGAPARPAGQASPDSLAGVLRRVWEENPLVLQALSVLEGTGYDISTARAGHFPYAQIGASLTEKEENSNTVLSLVLPLWSGGAVEAEVDQAKARQAAALSGVTSTRLQLGQRTIEAYLNVAMAQEQAAQWSNYLGSLKRLLGTIERRSEKGVAPIADVQTAISRLRQAEVGAEANRALLLTSRTQLATLLNVTPAGVDWPDESYLLTEEEVLSSADRIEQHPDRVRAMTEVKLAEATARRARAGLWPALSLQHRKQLEGLAFDPTNDDVTQVVVSFATNSGLRGFRGLQAESQRVEAAKSRMDSVTREVSSALNIDRAQMRAVAAQLVVQEKAAQATAALVDSFTRQYEVGRRGWLEVLNASREANDTQLQFITLKRNYWLANCKLALDALYWHRIGADPEADTAGGE